jgi:hypothetical protein
MKTSSTLVLIFGILLVLIQYAAYKGNDFQFQPLYKSDDFSTMLAINSGQIIGFNFFGLLGLILIIIAVTRKSKSK